MMTNAIDAGIGDLYIDAGTGLATGAASTQPLDMSDLSAQTLAISGARKEIVFIEDNVPDIDTLVKGIGNSKQVVILDSSQDGLHQIAQTLAGQSHVDAVHIISHGEAGAASLGNLLLDAGNLSAHQADLQAIGHSLSPGGDILLYGCDIGAGSGASFVQQLAVATGADVAASNDLTGSAALGGDWNLEVASGHIETAPVINAHTAALYQGVLGLSNQTVTFSTDANFVSRPADVYAGSSGDVVYRVGGNDAYRLVADAANTAVTVYSSASPNPYLNIAGQPVSEPVHERTVTLSFQGGQVFTLNSLQLSDFEASGLGASDSKAQTLIFTGYDSNNNVIATQSVPVVDQTSYATATLSGFTDVKKITVTTTDNGGYLKFVAVDNMVFGDIHAAVVAPTITSVSATTPNGAYNAGQVIHITVTFDQAVVVNTAGGTPQLTLETGTADHSAFYASGSGSNTLTFNYTVQAGDTSADLDYLSAAALSPNGATIKDYSTGTNTASLVLPTPGSAGSLGANKSIVIDTTPPAAPSTPDLDAGSDTGSSNTDNLTSATTPVFHGTAEAGATVKLYDTDGTTVLGSTTATGGSWTITSSTLSEGGHTLSARATDAAGNTSAVSSGLSITVDTMAPTVSVSSDQASLAKGQSATVTFSFSEDPGPSFTAGDISVSGGTLGAISGSGLTRNAVFTPTQNVNSGTASIGVTDHSYTDAAGNTGAAGSPVTISYDTLAPVVSIGSDHASMHAGDTATVTFTFSEDPGASFSWDGSAGDVTVSGGTLSALQGSGTTRTAIFTPTPGINGGTASIAIAAGTYQDAAGNQGAGASLSLPYDTLAPAQPSKPVLDPASDSGASSTDGVTNQNTVSISGSAEAGSTVHLMDGGSVIGSATATGGSYTIVATLVGEGEHDIVAVARDAAGNDSAGSTPLVVVLDQTPPGTTVSSATLSADTGSSSTDLVTKVASQTISGTLSANLAAGEQVMVSLDNGATWTAATTSVGANTWSLAATLAGSDVLKVQVVDQAGNPGTAYSHGYTLDTTAPAAPSAPDLATASDSGSSHTDNITAVTTPTFTGTAEAGSTVHLYDGATDIGSQVADGSGNWSITSSTLGAGSHTITAAAVDVAGNVGTASPGLTIQIVTGGPTVGVADMALSHDSGASAVDFITNVAAQTLSGHLNGVLANGEQVQVSLDDGASWNDAVATVGSAGWSYATTLLSGSHDIQVRVTDAVDNSGPVTTQAYTLDTTAPTLSIASSAAQLKAGETATLTFTFSEDPGTGFSVGDISVSGGTVGNLAGSGLTRTATFTPGGQLDGVVASISASGYSDPAGNPGSASNLLHIAVDTVAPNAPPAPALATASDTGAVGDGITETTSPVIDGTALANAPVTLYDTVGGSQVLVGTATADSTGHWSIATSLTYGTHALTAVQSDAAGNVSVASATFALEIDAPAPPTPPATLIDGVPVDIEPVALPGGAIGSAVTIPIVSTTRAESSGAPGVADIPLAGTQGSTVLLAQLAAGYGLSASGADVPVAQGSALLIAAIKAATPTHAADDQGHLTGNGLSFLDGLAAGSSLLVETVKPVGSAAAADGTLTLSGPAAMAGQGTALVIDASGLAAGNTINLAHVDFAAVIGTASVATQGSYTMLSGDAASQHFTVTAGGSGSVFAGAGDDVLGVVAGGGSQAPTAGVTLLHGGSGNDVATFSGASSDYEVAYHNGYVMVSSKAAPDVQAMLVNVEQLQFSDASVAVQNSTDMNTLAGMYQTVLGRQADLQGIEYWADAHQAGASWGAVAIDMIGSTEHTAGQQGFNGNATHDVTLLYSALFNRDPDAVGLAYWTNAMSHGASLAQVAGAMVQSTEMDAHNIAAAGWNFSV